MRKLSLLLTISFAFDSSIVYGFHYPLANARLGSSRSSTWDCNDKRFTSKTPRAISTTQLQVANPSFSAVNTLVSSVASPVGALVVLATVILIHESGHYLAARALGIQVEEFSVGVGPALLRTQLWGNDFSLRAIPLGGYVKFPEHYNITLAQQRETEQMYLESLTETPFQRKVSNILSLGVYEELLRKEEERLKQAQKQARPWWKQWGRPPQQQQQPSKMTTTSEIEYYKNPDLLQNRPWPERAMVIAGGVVFNLILAFAIYFGQVTLGNGLVKPVVEPGARVSVTPTGDAAAVGLLQKGDVILKVNGMPLAGTSSTSTISGTQQQTVSTKPLSALAAQQAINDFIAKIQATPDGESLQLQILKANVANARDASPSSLVDLTIRPKSNGQVQAIGVLLGPNIRRMERIQTTSLGEASRIAGKLSGPIGLIQTGSEVVSTSDMAAVMMFAAAISVNLAVVNSLPLPALDGGQMVFILVEAISRRKVDQRLQENITSVAVLLLLLLSLSTTVGDVEGLFAK